MPKPSTGQRDGAFVVFKGWDMPIHDIAYYPKLSGQIDKLKNIALGNPGALITAFNSDGAMKSCPSHEYSMWTEKAGTDLYVRVEYPGWYFIQGMDSWGNDLENSSLGTNVAAIMVNTIVNFPEEKSNRVACFNTDGYVKSKVVSNLMRRWDFPLEGLYVRIDFPGYEFWQGVHSPGGDIITRLDLANDIPALVSTSNSYPNSLGFTSDGWIKETMKVPPPDKHSSYTAPNQGSYERIEWPEFVYLPMLDSWGSDARRSTGRLWETIKNAREDGNIVAFNTDGYMKTALADNPYEKSEALWGLYVKEPKLTSFDSANTAADSVNTAIFLLKGSAIVWGKWLLADSGVRAEYNKAVAFGSQDILARMNQGKITPAEAAREAVDMRNLLLTNMRRQTSPSGLVFAQAIKPAGLPYQTLLDKYAQKRYTKPFAQLTAEEASQVAGDTIDAAGRANRTVTSIMKRVGYVSKGLIGIGVAVSAYQVVTAQDWKYEVGRQVASWSGAIAGGELGAGVGAILGPVGAIVGGLVGGIIGGLAGDGMAQLARWFFGGSSSLSAKEILGPALHGAISAAVQDQLKQSGQNFHVHQILSTHLSKEHTAQFDTVSIAKDIVATKSEMRVDVQVVATIVWVDTPEGLLPGNGANPADLMTLMNWAAYNLPPQ